jgi:hypothetical protein
MKTYAALSTLALGVSLAAPGCIEASQEPLDYPAAAVIKGGDTATVGRWTITLSRATIALGPFYFCAATSGSSTLCESSISELARTNVINTPFSAPVSLGSVHGFSGPIRSVSYDFGISWFPTQREATPAPALPSGHSMHLEGDARTGVGASAQTIHLEADVDVTPQFQGQNAISTAPALADVHTTNTRLEVSLEPAAWFKQLDFDALLAQGVTSLTITPGTPAHNALLVGIKNLAPLEFHWTTN